MVALVPDWHLFERSAFALLKQLLHVSLDTSPRHIARPYTSSGCSPALLLEKPDSTDLAEIEDRSASRFCEKAAVLDPVHTRFSGSCSAVAN
jgi:hypothetical protein